METTVSKEIPGAPSPKPVLFLYECGFGENLMQKYGSDFQAVVVNPDIFECVKPVKDYLVQLYTEHDVSIVGVEEEGGYLLYRGGIFHEFGVKWQEQHCTNQPYKTSPVGVDILGSDGMHCRASNCLAVHVHSAVSAEELLPHDFAGPHDPNWEPSL